MMTKKGLVKALWNLIRIRKLSNYRQLWIGRYSFLIFVYNIIRRLVDMVKSLIYFSILPEELFYVPVLSCIVNNKVFIL